MTINVMDQYIELTKKQINAYMKLVLGSKYDKKYCELYTQKYINIRYYNFYEDDITNTMRRKIIEKLKEFQENLTINNIQDREIIQQMCIFYYYVLYFDNVVHYKSLEKIIEKISRLRKKILNKTSDDFQENLYNQITQYMKEKEELLNKFHSNEFYIKISNYQDKANVYRINLKYNIRFPEIYSNYAIEKAFTTGIIDEDRLIIEYYLTTIQVIKDILKQNFKKQYIVEFSNTILKKPKKIKSLLKIINNSAIQDKISLKIRYENFLKNKEKIYELLKEGFKITIILDNSFEPEYMNIENLKMFKYVIVNKNLKYCDKIQGDNVIKI